VVPGGILVSENSTKSVTHTAVYYENTYGPSEANNSGETEIKQNKVSAIISLLYSTHIFSF